MMAQTKLLKKAWYQGHYDTTMIDWNTALNTENDALEVLTKDTLDAI